MQNPSQQPEPLTAEPEMTQFSSRKGAGSAANSAAGQTANGTATTANSTATSAIAPVRPMNLNEPMGMGVNPTDANSMKGSSVMQNSSKLFVPLCVVVIIAGAATGFGLDKLYAKTTPGAAQVYQGQIQGRVATDVAAIQNGQVFGSADESTFKDNAEGYLVAGGIDGEGSEHLLRAGGVSQTVYLTSSVTDLSKFEGMQIKVWGETFKAQKAGWLMDVGRVQVENTKATAPTDSTSAK